MLDGACSREREEPISTHFIRARAHHPVFPLSCLCNISPTDVHYLHTRLESQFDSIQFGRRPSSLASISHKNATMKQSPYSHECCKHPKSARFAPTTHRLANICQYLPLTTTEKRVGLQSPTRPRTALRPNAPHGHYADTEKVLAHIQPLAPCD
jgi:hypothetical protein